jgi:hypothetical protein
MPSLRPECVLTHDRRGEKIVAVRGCGNTLRQERRRLTGLSHRSLGLVLVSGVVIVAAAGGASASTGVGPTQAQAGPPPIPKTPPAAAQTGRRSPGASLPLPRCTIRGTAKGDVLRGTRRTDVICGLGGGDTIYAGRGDIILGGGGNDVAYARNASSNIIRGGAGVDRAKVDKGLDIVEEVERLL